MKHAPVDYECPFCRVAESLPTPASESALFWRSYACLPLLGYTILRAYRATVLSLSPRGLITRACSNKSLFDIPDDLRTDIFHATRLLAVAITKDLLRSPSHRSARLRLGAGKRYHLSI